MEKRLRGEKKSFPIRQKTSLDMHLIYDKPSGKNELLAVVELSVP